MKSNAFWWKKFITTLASQRSICLNDLYHHRDLGELAVEGDIHAFVSVLQMNVPWMHNGMKKSREKARIFPLPRFAGGKWSRFWEKGLRSLVSSLLRRRSKCFNLVAWAMAAQAAAPLWNWVTQCYARNEWVNVQEVYFMNGCQEHKAVAIEQWGVFAYGTWHTHFNIRMWIRWTTVVQWCWICWMHCCLISALRDKLLKLLSFLILINVHHYTQFINIQFCIVHAVITNFHQ